MAYTTKYKYVWVPGYWYSTKRWVSTRYYVPKTYWVWVPGHRYGWGWLSVWIPGHYELRVKWVKKTTGFWLTTWHYNKGYWKKIAYEVYIFTPIKITKVVFEKKDMPVYFSYNLDMDRAQKRIEHSRNLFFGSVALLGGLNYAQQDLITEGISKIYEGGDEYLQHLNETGRGDDYRLSSFRSSLLHLIFFKWRNHNGNEKKFWQVLDCRLYIQFNFIRYTDCRKSCI